MRFRGWYWLALIAVLIRPGPSPSAPTTAAGIGEGKRLFVSTGCGSCHTLRDAGTTGKVGPNLDGVKPSPARVIDQVTNGGAVMQSFKNQLSAAQIKAVASYVSSVAGR